MAIGKTPGLRREQVEKAVSALLKYIGTQKADSKDLLEDEEYLYLVTASQNYLQDQALYIHLLFLHPFVKPAEYCTQENPSTAQESIPYQTVRLCLV